MDFELLYSSCADAIIDYENPFDEPQCLKPSQGFPTLTAAFWSKYLI